MKRLTVHVLYEHGSDRQPFGASQIRLLRPLSHPAVQDSLRLTAGLNYGGQVVDAVVMDRLWRPDVSLTLVERLTDDVHRAGARLIYSIDDNLLDLAAENKDWQPTDEQFRVLAFMLRQADGIMVATSALRERLSGYNRNIVVVPNALDERLIGSVRDARGIGAAALSGPRGIARMKALLRRVLNRTPSDSVVSPRRIVVGYMGTRSHDVDLLMVQPALLEVWRRHRDQLEFQMVGVLAHQETREKLGELPVRFVVPPPGGWEYLRFMPWFTGQLRWDIAIAPLQDSPFSRCKSDIKFLDYSALGAAGIYSRVPAYASTVRHLKTGWLAKNEPSAWAEALERLLADATLRAQIAANASEYLYTDRVLAHCAPDWFMALEFLLS
jgi:glycosyltransferase involved in cell wall biosynthesis